MFYAYWHRRNKEGMRVKDVEDRIPAKLTVSILLLEIRRKKLLFVFMALNIAQGDKKYISKKDA